MAEGQSLTSICSSPHVSTRQSTKQLHGWLSVGASMKSGTPTPSSHGEVGCGRLLSSRLRKDAIYSEIRLYTRALHFRAWHA